MTVWLHNLTYFGLSIWDHRIIYTFDFNKLSVLNEECRGRRNKQNHFLPRGTSSSVEFYCELQRILLLGAALPCLWKHLPAKELKCFFLAKNNKLSNLVGHFWRSMRHTKIINQIILYIVNNFNKHLLCYFQFAEKFQEVKEAAKLARDRSQEKIETSSNHSQVCNLTLIPICIQDK